MILKIAAGLIACLPPQVVGQPTINDMACKLQKLVPVQKLYRVYARLVTREAQGGNHLANFLAPLEKCVGHSFKKFGPLSKNSSSPLASQAGYRPGLCM